MKTEKKRDYYLKRASMGCSNCKTLSAVIDPISALCIRCKKRLLIHGSPAISKPSLKREIETAHLRIVYACNNDKSEEAFDNFMLSFASPNKSDPLRRLCWLNFVELKAFDGKPLMRFFDALVQSYAVTIYEENGGRFDEKRKQFQFCIGRACVSPWHRRRKVANGFRYNRQERINLMAKPRLMLRAFEQIFIGAGLVRYLSKITNEIRKK